MESYALTIKLLLSPVHIFADSSQRVYWLYGLSALTLAIVCVVFQKKSQGSLFSYLLPKSLLLHPSALDDYLFFYINAIFQGVFITGLFSGFSIVVSYAVFEKLADAAAPMVYLPEGTGGIVVCTLVLALAGDLALYLSHYMQHKIAWLWEFHKVHHSAEVLTPITVFRMHPVDNLLAFSLGGLFNGVVLGCLLWMSGESFGFYNVAGTNILLIVFYLAGYNLRHSHVWLSFGPVLERIFISPAQHQIHHSSDPRHYDKNLGFMFAFWDGLLGTLYVPKSHEKLNFGLGKRENERFNGLWNLYLMPFVQLFEKLRLKPKIGLKNGASVVLFFTIVGSAIYWNQQAAELDPVEQGIYLEDMTWKEVRQALLEGKTTVIIPTGGTEQNGPHVVLGKHNFIVRYTAGQIAKTLGDALVAPVLSYVPEGAITQPEGHMRFPGTLSVSDAVFANVLRFTAESMRQHGFKTIVFLGDSGGNQAVQQQVADDLNRIWQMDGVQVIQAGDYYRNNGQVDFLRKQGFTDVLIGSHAGIRDTSELMAVHSEGVRQAALKNYSQANFIEVGSDGDVSKASAALGKVLLELKIKAGVKQILQERF